MDIPSNAGHGGLGSAAEKTVKIDRAEAAAGKLHRELLTIVLFRASRKPPCFAVAVRPGEHIISSIVAY